ncbi:MAG: tyrosine-type recombinase/integrase [Eubacteriales bacterium]|nr:tyrosine-type recombinase/integrase [Eubacteriales bacterium]
MDHYVNMEMLEDFEQILKNEEKSHATIEKYLRDLRRFFVFLGKDTLLTKEKVIAYKNKLKETHAASSVNSMLAGLNHFFKEKGWYECVVKNLKVQRPLFRSSERELTKKEYCRLVEAAKKEGKDRLSLVLQTLASTGIRVSELPFITAEALDVGRAKVSLKGKLRTVLLPKELCRKLKFYIKQKKIQNGSIFVTRSGKPLDRSNIFHEMKALCEAAGVNRKKVFPHNLRRLFAVTYYHMEKDLARLADLLGHSNINTTRIYIMVNGEEQVKQIELLGLVM